MVALSREEGVSIDLDPGTDGEAELSDESAMPCQVGPPSVTVQLESLFGFLGDEPVSAAVHEVQESMVVVQAVLDENEIGVESQ